MPHPCAKVSWDDDMTSQMTTQEVSVDACLTRVLRPYQRHGLVFLYKCLMGMNKSGCHGAILADEMGLGKTLQCISLLWTLLKQGPYGKPEAKRVLIVAPSSLCSNWKKELIRWLGSQRVQPFVVEGKNKPKDFANYPRSRIMIVSYEMFARNFDQVNEFGFDLLICDEGHRLKNSEAKILKVVRYLALISWSAVLSIVSLVLQLLAQLKCEKRILLTGTPIQNDLQELYTLSDFVNSGIFDSPSYYKKYFENPIVASQKPDAVEEEIELGRERAEELRELTKLFILRRTNDLINKYLPQKHELVIFCRLTPDQEALYDLAVNEWWNGRETSGVMPLAVILALKKICNHPKLLVDDKSEFVANAGIKERLAQVNAKRELSGKMFVVRVLMQTLKSSREKLVLVSYFTKTLDMLERLCSDQGFQFCRLDGSTSSGARMQIVDKFNSKDNHDCRWCYFFPRFRYVRLIENYFQFFAGVFLLSAKAGGVGLNLPGASRLVLFDSDWNPASDAQAMARIWRQGQKQSVYLYR